MSIMYWEGIAGEKCIQCGGYATHWYADVPLCCDCHGGGILTQEEAKVAHEKYSY